MPGDAQPVSGVPALRKDTIFLRLNEQTEDSAVNVRLGELLCDPLTSTEALTSPHPWFAQIGALRSMCGGYCIGRRSAKNDGAGLPSALTSRVLSRHHVKLVVDLHGVLWAMDLQSLHRTAVRRDGNTMALEAYEPFRLDEGDLLILGKPVASRDGVTHLPLRVRVHYAVAPPAKSMITHLGPLPVPKFAASIADIKLPRRAPTRGYGIPIMYESEHDEYLSEDDLPRDETLNDERVSNVACAGTPKTLEAVIPVPDDDEDSIVCTGSLPHSFPIQSALPGDSQTAQQSFGNTSTYPLAADLRESILSLTTKLPPSPSADRGDEDEDQRDDHVDDVCSEHSNDDVSERSDDDACTEHSQDDDDGLDDVIMSDAGEFSDEEVASDDEMEDDRVDLSEDNDGTDGEGSDYGFEEFSEQAEDEDRESLCGRDPDEEVYSSRDLGEDVYSRDAELPPSDEEDIDGEDDVEPAETFLRRLIHHRQPTPFARSSSPNPTVIPSSMPEEDDPTQRPGRAWDAEDPGSFGAINTATDAALEDSDEQLDTAGNGASANRAPSPSYSLASAVGSREPSPSYSPTSLVGSREPTPLNNLHSPTYTPSSHPGSPVSAPVRALPDHYPLFRPLGLYPAGQRLIFGRGRQPFGLGNAAGSSRPYSPPAPTSSLTDFPSRSSDSQDEDGTDERWEEAQRPEAPNVVIVPDEIEEPRLAADDVSDAEMETAPRMPTEAIYSLPPSPPASTGSHDAELMDPKIETVASTVPLTPPSPAYKVLVPESSTLHVSSSTESAATMDVATNTTSTTPRKRKLSALEEEAPAAPSPVANTIDTAARPTRRRRLGSFFKGVALGVGIGASFTFGALYQLGAE